jgi:hypothetical protein
MSRNLDLLVRQRNFAKCAAGLRTHRVKIPRAHKVLRQSARRVRRPAAQNLKSCAVVLGLACCVALATIAVGCQTAAPMARKAGVEIDPCAERLHEICGHLLLYYSAAGTLPKNLADLRGASSDPLPPLVCPISGKPYVYNPEGLAVQGRRGRVVIYDAAPPIHGGKRWAILADVGAGDKPLAARVILVPEGPVFSAGKP